MGSGIFSTPGEAAKHVSSPWLILGLWALAGLITLLQTLVTAELATRFPRAGGEYQYLKEAYGDFAAFFFGWSFTIFIVGGGAGTIAAAFGDFTAELLRLNHRWAAPALGCAAIAAVVGVNALGLRAGAATQIVLTLLKTAALVAIAIGAIAIHRRFTPTPSPALPVPAKESPIHAFFLALLPVFWSYTGATDSAKMAEETRDAPRSLPWALCGSALLLTAVYLLYNYALLCALPPAEMAGRRSVPSLVFSRAGAGVVGDFFLAASALVCVGAISSTILANVRVTFALARDGLTFNIFAGMSRRQAPIASLLLAGGLACSFVLYRRFEEILRIYFMASSLLFGLTYLSLIVFRRRDARARQTAHMDVFYVPLGVPIAVSLVALEAGLAMTILWADIQTGGRDSVATLLLLALVGAIYSIWTRGLGRQARDAAGRE
jgi:APA family basic amino acid/polyamine antiporter